MFYDQSDEDWICASAASIGKAITQAQAKAVVAAINVAANDPDVLAMLPKADTSSAIHRAQSLLQLERAGIAKDLAVAIYERDGTPDANFPYPDAAGVLRRLHNAGAKVAVVSDVHFDLRAIFDQYGLREYIDAWVFSFQHGVQKPDPTMFRLALDALEAAPDEALMVGDRAERDGGSTDAGIAALILPAVPPGANRGLGVVERFLG
ncbi:MAG: HAD-IA family hydrolase [Dehalococcoidia bacterium]|nr:HAD-IA family hydrolase [Dehalococcoidia bacterium]